MKESLSHGKNITWWNKFNKLFHNLKKTPTKPAHNKVDKDLRFEDIFFNEEGYKYVLNILIQKKFISPVSHVWMDLSSGNKKLMVVILKKLQYLGYYNLNKSLSSKQIQAICLNSWQVNIAIDTIKHIKHTDIIIGYFHTFDTFKN